VTVLPCMFDFFQRDRAAHCGYAFRTSVPGGQASHFAVDQPRLRQVGDSQTRRGPTHTHAANCLLATSIYPPSLRRSLRRCDASLDCWMRMRSRSRCRIKLLNDLTHAWPCAIVCWIVSLVMVTDGVNVLSVHLQCAHAPLTR
jgi:hypothetical protein